jgi:prepilin-type processing-associated H-X9-DG protein
MSRARLSFTEVLVIVAIISVVASVLGPALLAKPRECGIRSACVNNLKQVGLVLNLYASENEGKFPPIDDSPGNFMFEGNVMYPEYLTDVHIVACPSDPDYQWNTNFRLDADHSDGTKAGQIHPDCITDMSYSYIGWMVMTDHEAIGFFDAYDNGLLPWGRDHDLIVHPGLGTGEGNAIYRLSQEVDRFLIPDTNTPIQGDESGASIVPVMWDQISTHISEFNHVPAGQNVLYLDGHVEFHRYDLGSTEFPISPMTAFLYDAFTRDPIPHCEE